MCSLTVHACALRTQWHVSDVTRNNTMSYSYMYYPQLCFSTGTHNGRCPHYALLFSKIARYYFKISPIFWSNWSTNNKPTDHCMRCRDKTLNSIVWMHWISGTFKSKAKQLQKRDPDSRLQTRLVCLPPPTNKIKYSVNCCRWQFHSHWLLAACILLADKVRYIMSSTVTTSFYN